MTCVCGSEPAFYNGGPACAILTFCYKALQTNEAKNLGVEGGHWRGRAGLRCARAKLGVDVELPPSPRTVRVVKQGGRGHCRDAECKWFAIVRGREAALSDHMKMCFPQVRLRKRFNARDSAVDVELAVVDLQGIDR